MSEDQIRQYRRYKVEWTVDLKVPQWEDALQLTTDNISRGGIFVRSDEHVPEGAELDVTLQLPDQTSLEVKGTVVHSLGVEDAKATHRIAGFGLRFAEEHAVDLELLEATAASHAGGRNTYKLEERHFVLPALLRHSDGRVAEPTRAYPLEKPPEPEPQLPVDFGSGLHVAVPAARRPKRPAPRQGARTMPPLFFDEGGPTDVGIVPPLEESSGPEATPIFGIDFGTTYTSIALVQEGGVCVLEDADGNPMIPSVVCYPTRGASPIVGWAAREMVPTHRDSTFVSFKRLLGRDYDDPRVAAFIAASPVQLERAADGSVVGRVQGGLVTMPEVAAEVLREAMALGERASGLPVRRAVISAPVRFGERERDAIEKAATLAGLEISAIIDEPAAAAMAYGLGRAEGERIAIFDFGGGSFDCAVLEIRNQRLSMLASGGDAWLGGDDFDLAMANHAADIFAQVNEVDVRERPAEWQRVILLAERVKRKLSTDNAVDLRARRIVQLADGNLDLQIRFNRRLFAELCTKLVERALAEMGQRLHEAGVNPHDLDHLVLTGGVSRTPLVRQKLRGFLQREIELAVNPEQAMVVGTAIYARFLQLTGKKISF